MKGWSKEEKELVESLLWYLLNDKDVNEWEHGFLKSLIERSQDTYTDKQLTKIEDIIEKCKGYEYRNIIKLVIGELRNQNKSYSTQLNEFMGEEGFNVLIKPNKIK